MSMKRSEIRRVNIKYLEEFFYSIILFKDFPVKRKLRAESWAQDFYEQLSDEDKQALYLQIKNNNQQMSDVVTTTPWGGYSAQGYF